MNLNSKDVKVFPFGKSRPDDPYSNILNESNITSIIKAAALDDSYVINYDKTDNVIDFVICGYYFKTNISSVVEKGWKNIHAKISLTGGEYKQLLGGDLALVSSGEGTSTDPFVLSGSGLICVTSDQKFFKYQLSEGESNARIVVPTRGEIYLNGNEINIAEEGNVAVIDPSEEENTIRFSLHANDTSENIFINFITQNPSQECKFTGVAFLEKVDSEEDSLLLLTQNENNQYEVPLQRLIYCGTSTELV